MTAGEVFGRCGSIGDFGSVGSTMAPAARAASPVVANIATWAGCVLARLHGPWSTTSMAAMVTPATISAITPGWRRALDMECAKRACVIERSACFLPQVNSLERPPVPLSRAGSQRQRGPPGGGPHIHRVSLG
nr:hypothetical protein BDOA9_0159370 [Bradyrhizobium sp. DOA9]